MFQDETPLFLAAREGSLEAAKCLLDAFANRDITDHMERLPRDVADERMHHDIVRLLDTYGLSSPMPVNSCMTGSPMQASHQYMHQPHSKKKTKRSRQNSNQGVNPNMPVKEAGPVSPNEAEKMQKPTKPRKKKAQSKAGSRNTQARSSSTDSSPVNSLESPQHSFNELPPSYDNACHGQIVGHHTLEDSIPSSCAMTRGVNSQENSDSLAQHYNSSPLLNHASPSMLDGSPQLQDHHQDWSVDHMHLPVTAPMSMSPPLSHGSPQSVTSPVKKSFPTSPIHMQAMQQNAHMHMNRMQNSPHNRFNGECGYHNDHMDDMSRYTHGPVRQKSNQPTAYTVHMGIEQYPTPPSQHSQMSSESTPQHNGQIALPEHYLTPSPDSPGQWSSSSPHSAQSDWSEGINSPVQCMSIRNQNGGRHSSEGVYI